MSEVVAKTDLAMHIEIETKELAQALNFASSLVEKRNVIETLSKIKLKASSDGLLQIGATDIDLYLDQTLGAHIINGGECSVSTALFSDVIRKIPDSKVTLQHQPGENKLEIKASNCCFELYTPRDDLFPEMEDVAGNVKFMIPATDLLNLMELSHFAMSNDETRYNLNGIYLHKDSNYIAASALDGHRLAVVRRQVAGQEQAPDIGVILPKKTILELMKILKSPKISSQDIEVTINDTRIRFVTSGVVLLSKIIDGTFPDYHAFVPTSDESGKLTIICSNLSESINRIATVTLDKFRSVRLQINNGGITVSASGEARGKATEQIVASNEQDKICSYVGEEITIGFNPKYIIDALTCVQGDSAELYFASASSPVLVKDPSQPQNDFVVMPVKV